MQALMKGLETNRDAGVLYLLGPKTRKAAKDIGVIRPLAKRVIILACREKYNPHDVLGALASGADDVRSLENFPRSADEVSAMFRGGGSADGPISLDPAVVQPNSIVFVATPFDKRRTAFEPACRAALEHFNLTPLPGDHEFASKQNLMDKVRGEIAAACLVIANCSEPLNTDVILELGLAHGMGKPCFIARKRDRASSHTAWRGGAIGRIAALGGAGLCAGAIRAADLRRFDFGGAAGDFSWGAGGVSHAGALAGDAGIVCGHAGLLGAVALVSQRTAGALVWVLVRA